jgi:hypothetical protein
LGKRVVVQHIPLGGILSWNPDAGQTVSHLRRNTPGGTGSSLRATARPPVEPIAGPTYRSSHYLPAPPH